MAMSKTRQMFPAGTWVKAKYNGGIFIGTVKVAPPTGENSNKRYVYFNKMLDKQSGKFERISTHGEWVCVNNLKEVDVETEADNTLVITVNETTRKTTLRDSNNRKVVARCHPDDTFSEKIGVSTVLSRYYDGFADGDHVYSVEANGQIGDIVYRKDRMNPKLKSELETRLALGNVFANKRNAEVAAKKIASVFSDNARTLP